MASNLYFRDPATGHFIPVEGERDKAGFEWDVSFEALLEPVRQAVAKKNKAYAEVKQQLTAATADARRWHQYVDAMIAMLPVTLRRFVTARLDASGRGIVEAGLWNYILDRTAAYEPAALSPKARRDVIEAAEEWHAARQAFFVNAEATDQYGRLLTCMSTAERNLRDAVEAHLKAER